MANKLFALDTNILIYLEGNDAVKRSISEDLLSFAPVIPSQVVTEFLNVTRRLRNISKLQAMNEAAALFADCKILYTEDMQRGLLVNKKLQIINPFAAT